MREYILKRILISIPALIGVSLAIFSLIRVVPGDAVVAMVGDVGVMGKDQEAKIRHELGLDRPFVNQYFTWTGGLIRGDMGDSMWTGQPVFNEIKRTFPVSFELALFALIVAMLVAIPIGIMSAVRQDTPIDYIGRFISIGGLSIPDFWLGTMILVFLSIWLHWIPPVVFISIKEDPASNLKQYVLPSLILGFRLSATSMRMTRSSMLEVLREDYIRTAWAKGLKERVVIARHALKNAFIPVVTIVGAQAGYLLGGTVIIESIFGLPGMGRLTLDAIIHRDYPQIQANVMLVAVIMVVSNLLVDLSYGWLDPRLPLQR